MHEISHTPNNKKFPKFRNDCFNVSRLLFSNSGFIFHSQRSKQSLKPQRACPWRKIYGSMFFSPLSFFFYQNHPKLNEMFTPWTKNLYLFCCSIISWKLFRGSLIHVRIGAASKMLFTGNYASEMSVSLISDRILAVPVQASTRMLHSRAALARVRVRACSYFNTYTRKLNMSEYLTSSTFSFSTIRRGTWKGGRWWCICLPGTPPISFMRSAWLSKPIKALLIREKRFLAKDLVCCQYYSYQISLSDDGCLR